MDKLLKEAEKEAACQFLETGAKSAFVEGVKWYLDRQAGAGLTALRLLQAVMGVQTFPGNQNDFVDAGGPEHAEDLYTKQIPEFLAQQKEAIHRMEGARGVVIGIDYAAGPDRSGEPVPEADRLELLPSKKLTCSALYQLLGDLRGDLPRVIRMTRAQYRDLIADCRQTNRGYLCPGTGYNAKMFDGIPLAVVE